jgi:pyruvate dehydrogenase E1 component alpha subunit
MDLTHLYHQMLRARSLESVVAELWASGLISGEMHLGTGEEAVAAGVVTHLRDGDGLSLAHRCSPALVVRGVPLVPILREMLGCADGLAGGMAGHMHLMSKDHLATSSGIVGASLPVGAGFALAADRLRPGAIAVSFTGDGAMNQGMALETLNLATVWSLPLLIVCIDNGWAITTKTGAVSGGELSQRAASFGLVIDKVDGSDVEAVYEVAGGLIARMRRKSTPCFLYTGCPRLDGHFLGDPLLRQAKDPLGEGRATLTSVTRAALTRTGAGIAKRFASATAMLSIMAKARNVATRDSRGDPLRTARETVKRRHPDALERIEAEVAQEMEAAVLAATGSEQPHDA